MSVHAAKAGGRIRHYSRRERQGMSGGRLPACVAGACRAEAQRAKAGGPLAGTTATTGSWERGRGRKTLGFSPKRCVLGISL